MDIIKINDWMFIIGVLLVINIVMTWFVMGKLNYLLSYVPYNQGLAMDTQSRDMDSLESKLDDINSSIEDLSSDIDSLKPKTRDDYDDDY
jgi:outer membrane murein-binding lipoprotein Lpp